MHSDPMIQLLEGAVAVAWRNRREHGLPLLGRFHVPVSCLRLLGPNALDIILRLVHWQLGRLNLEGHCLRRKLGRHSRLVR